MFPISLATNKIQNTENIRGRTEGTTEDREVWYQERSALGHGRPERGKANSQQLTDK